MAWKGYDPNASKQHKITVSYSEFASAITSYIYCVRIEDLDTGFVDELLSTGLDLKVFDSTGTECKRWLDDTFNKGTYHGFLWWVSYASDIADNDFYLYAGSGSTTSNDSECWTDAGYVTRHPFNESSGDAIDSCVNYDGTTQDLTHGQNGEFDTGFEDNHSYKAKILLGDVTELDSTANFTLSFYASLDTSVTNSHFFARYLSASYTTEVYMVTGNMYVSINDGSSHTCHISSTGLSFDGVYRKYTIVYDGTKSTNAEKLRIFWEDAQKTIYFGSTTIPTTTGNCGGGITNWMQRNLSLQGRLDEVRISDQTLSDSFIDSSYSMESDLENWWTFGSVDNKPDGEASTDNNRDGRVFRRHRRIMRASLSKKRRWNRR